MNPALLSIENLRTGYGPIEVLKSVSLNVERGEIVTVLGANGAGKTTLLLTISGIQPIRSGKVTFDSSPIESTEAHDLVKFGMAHVPEGRKIFARQTVKENLELGAFIRNDKDGIREDMEKIFKLFPILQQRAGQLGGTLSGGEQQMLAIGRALMSRPKMLLLDEPSMGVAPILVQRIFETIQQLNSEGMTILLVEQNAHLALQIAKRGYVMETGEIAFEAPAGELLQDPRIREAYLGD